MKKWLLLPCVFLVACGGGGGGTEPVPNVPNNFDYPELENGIYTGTSSGTGFPVSAYNATMEVTDSGVTLTVDGYPSISLQRKWENHVTFDGTEANVVIDPSEKNKGGYQVTISREGPGWFTRVYTPWRTWELK